MTMTGTRIRLTGCAKIFADGTRALEPLDLEVNAGETLVFLGPSGCGKTTTLRLIAGLEMPDAGGRILFDDEDVTALPIEKRNVGMVFQSYALFPNMSVAGNIAYGLKIRCVPQADRRRRVAEMLEMMRITELADRSIDQLSGGQRQRVALARALAVEPRVLLLDEPLTALDAKLREDLRLEIDRLLRRLGITAIYVTHDQAEAMALGDRIVVMSKGRVAQIGRPRDIYLKPADRFVADFIGSMNRLSGMVRSGVLELPGGSLPWAGPDGPVEAALRPESLRLAEEGMPALTGTVISAFFLGDRQRLIVGGIAPEPLIADVPNRIEIASGDSVRLTFDADALIQLSS